MRMTTLVKSKKAVTEVIAAIFLIGIAIVAAAAIIPVVSLKMKSDTQSAGTFIATDSDHDGLIDKMDLPLKNIGHVNAEIVSISILQNNIEYLWVTIEEDIEIGESLDVNIYALGALQQIRPFISFNVIVTFQDGTYTSPGYTTTISSIVPEEVIPSISDEENNPAFVGYQFLVERTSEDDEYRQNDFPTTVGFSPTLWFLLGAFEDQNKKPSLATDYINLCGNGLEADYYPYVLDEREFTEGKIGTQSNHKVMCYNDSGVHPGLLALTKYGNWDKQDPLNWGKYGVVYMWSYIYVPGSQALNVDMAAKGASEYKVWLNGDLEITSGKMKKVWYKAVGGVTLNPGLNLIMMKISAKTDAHFAGQVLFYNPTINAQIGSFYSIWPTINDL